MTPTNLKTLIRHEGGSPPWAEHLRLPRPADQPGGYRRGRLGTCRGH
jgi:hypothetical protein